MAVQVPGNLERTNLPDTPSVGRIDTPASNAAQVQESQTQSAEVLGGSVVHYVRTQEAYTADTTATSLATKYQDFALSKLEGDPGGKPVQDPITGETTMSAPTVGVKSMGGDPAPHYQQYQKDLENYVDGIKSSDTYQKASKVTQQAVDARLSVVQRRMYDRQSVAYQAQNTQYLSQVAEQADKQAQGNVIDAATAHIDIKDPNTTLPIEDALNKLRSNRLQEAAKIGKATPVYDPNPDHIDPDTGQRAVIDYKNIAPDISMKIAKSQSDSLSESVKILASSGDIEGAKFLMEQYNHAIDPVHRAAIQEKINKESINQDALDLFSQAKQLPYADGVKMINDKAEKPEVQLKALANLDTYRKRMEGSQVDSDKTNYNEAFGRIAQRQRSGSPFVDANDMRNDPVMKPLIDNIKDEKMKATLDHLLEPPKVSTPAAIDKMYTAIQDGSLEGKSVEDASRELGPGLSNADRKFALTQLNKINSPDPSKQNKQLGAMFKMGEEALISGNVVKYMSGTNRLNTTNTKILIDFKNQLRDDMDSWEDNMTNKQQKEIVDQNFADFMKNRPHKQSFFERVKTFISPTTTAAPEGPQPLPQPSTSSTPGVQSGGNAVQSKLEAAKAFQKATGNLPDLDTDAGRAAFQKFINSGGK